MDDILGAYNSAHEPQMEPANACNEYGVHVDRFYDERAPELPRWRSDCT